MTMYFLASVGLYDAPQVDIIMPREKIRFMIALLYGEQCIAWLLMENRPAKNNIRCGMTLHELVNRIAY